jgi:hypothetical protein
MSPSDIHQGSQIIIQEVVILKEAKKPNIHNHTSQQKLLPVMVMILDQPAGKVIHHYSEGQYQDIYRNKYCIEIARNKQQERPAILVRQQKVHSRRHYKEEDEVE